MGPGSRSANASLGRDDTKCVTPRVDASPKARIFAAWISNYQKNSKHFATQRGVSRATR
jgi:hypothetical protein